jgi:hypothetical protein
VIFGHLPRYPLFFLFFFVQLIGSWEKWTSYPLPIAESLGAMIGDDFVVVSGYTGNWGQVTKKVYAYNVKDPAAIWREMDDVPVDIGFSHAAFAVDGMVMYICGGYIGATPGPHTDKCLKYYHTNEKGKQFEFLPNLPEGRGGGGLFYMKSSNSLLFSLGAIRPAGNAFDQRNTWELSLDNLGAGWQDRQDIPYEGNHVSHVTANYEGKQRHFMLGGQERSSEGDGNLDDNFEWDNINKTWIRQTSMPFARGHASSSTIPYGCGFIIIAGAVNGGTQTKDISYFGLDTNSWSRVGDLVEKINTPVCDIVRFGPGDDWIYCNTGSIAFKWAWRCRITLA